MTAVLTILIWATADSLVNDTGVVTVNVDLTPPPGAQRMIIDADARSAACEVQVSGSRRLVEFVQSRAPWKARFPIPDLPTGPSTIPLDRAVLKRQLTERWNEFRRLSVVAVQPSEVPVVIDHWVTHEVDVVTRRLTLNYEVEPQLQRFSVAVRMRESRYAQEPPDQRLQIDLSADIERLLKDKPVGQSVTVPVALNNAAFGPDAELSPNTINVSATVRAERTTTQIPTVPILAAVSFANLEDSVQAVTRDGTPLTLVTQTVTVAGPAEEVAKLVRGVTRAYGIVHLKQQDFEEVNIPKLVKPEYLLPPGVLLAAEPASIEFKLIRVSNTESGGG